MTTTPLMRVFFAPIEEQLQVRQFSSGNLWTNIYSAFTERHVWPRGFPLDEVHKEKASTFIWGERKYVRTGDVIIQGLADGDPDVDAVYRLTASKLAGIDFDAGDPVMIPKNTWTPFNSQATQWPKKLFPLMYLPATCPFRMTDIWRSFVAQRLMREVDSHLIYSTSVVYQDRNEHDLMRDFSEEIEGYQGYNNLIMLLESLTLERDQSAIFKNLRTAYSAMAKEGFVKDEELPLLENWIMDLETLGFL